MATPSGPDRAIENAKRIAGESQRPFAATRKGQNAYGVIFDGRSKAIVGSKHGEPIDLSDEVEARVREVAAKHGVWFEGDGKDVAPNARLFGGKSAYRGSWDDALAKTIDGYPAHFLSGLFANVEENGQINHFVDASLSIFDSLLKHQRGMRYFKDRTYTARTLEQFLRLASDDAQDFLVMAQKRATKANLAAFFKAGEARMFPANWDKYPHNAGKLMKKVEDARNRFLIDQPSGVYVAGAGHLIEILKLDRSLRMVGGERAKD